MPSTYELEPIVELTNWSVYEVPLHGPGAPWTRHFVGYAEEQGLAQVSPVILMFDPEHGVAASASRRVFQLVGNPGRHAEAEQMWVRWKSLNNIQQERDVTPGFFKAMDAWQGSAVA
jgi:hypothetical protein